MLLDADSRGPAGGHDAGDLRAALNAQLVRHRQELRHGQVRLLKTAYLAPLPPRLVALSSVSVSVPSIHYFM